MTIIILSDDKLCVLLPIINVLRLITSFLKAYITKLLGIKLYYTYIYYIVFMNIYILDFIYFHNLLLL